VIRSLAQRALAQARIPLYREGYALILSSAITSVFGFAYWIVAARSYSPHTVGLSAAAISAMFFISGVAQLNLSSALMRFLPVAGQKTARLIVYAYLLPMVVAAGVGAIFLAGLRTWTPNLGFLTHSFGFELWFVAAVIGWNIFVLQDAVLTGFRRAIWVCVDALAFSVARIALLVALAAPLPTYGMFASWTAAVVASVVPINAYIVFRLVRPRMRTTTSAGTEVTVRRLAHFASLDYVGWLAFLAATTLIPLMITERAGATANAYFALAWTLVVPLYLLSSNMGMSLVVSATTEDGLVSAYAARTLAQTMRLVVPAAAVIVAAAPWLLRVFGHSYSVHGTTTLRLLALSAIPNVITTLYVYSCRAQRRMSRLVVVLLAECGLVFGLSVWLLGVWGIAGVGAAWLIGQTAPTLVILACNPEFLGRKKRLMRRALAT
jgi:O-antigen/teichoic acid export membrane protein